MAERDAPRHAGPTDDLLMGRRTVLGGVVAAAAASIATRLGAPAVIAAQDDVLPSWNDGAARTAILDFIGSATNEGDDGFVPVADRIATFDQDGTLWVEHPIYGQAVFAIDRVKAMAPDHPDWATTAPYDAILSGDQQMLEWANAGERAHLAVLIYHDDAEREYAYGPAGGLPDTHVGTLTEALMPEATDDGWLVVSMKNDWNRIFPE